MRWPDWSTESPTPTSFPLHQPVVHLALEASPCTSPQSSLPNSANIHLPRPLRTVFSIGIVPLARVSHLFSLERAPSIVGRTRDLLETSRTIAQFHREFIACDSLSLPPGTGHFAQIRVLQWSHLLESRDSTEVDAGCGCGQLYAACGSLP